MLKYLETIFNAEYRLGVRSVFSSTFDCEYASYIVTNCKYMKSNISYRELVNFNTATPRNAVRLTIPRVKKSLSNSRGFLLVEGEEEPKLSYVVFRMYRVVKLLTEDIILS